MLLNDISRFGVKFYPLSFNSELFLALKCKLVEPLGFKFVKLRIQGDVLQVPLSKFAHSLYLWFAKSIFGNLRQNREINYQTYPFLKPSKLVLYGVCWLFVVIEDNA